MFTYLRNDFARVQGAIKMLTNDKMPNWACVLIYILLLPVGLALMPFAIVYMLYIKHQLSKLDE